MLNGKTKYLFIAVILVLVAFCGYFNYAFNCIYDTMLQEKIIDRQLDTDIVCTQIDKFIENDNDWNSYDYASILSAVAYFMDAAHRSGSYTELFDHNLNGLSKRSPLFEGAPFDPRDYPELIEAVNANESGHVTVSFDKVDVPEHDLHLYFRWIPTDNTLENRLIIITGVSKFSINTAIGDEIIYGAVVLIIITAIFNIGTVIMLCQLGYIRNLRKGSDKWRSRISS